MLKKLCYVTVGLLLALAVNAEEPKGNTTENLPKTAKNEPLFRDGKGYYSYKKTLEDLPLPSDGKVLIQYFYKYDCQVCLNGDDYLKQYAKHNKDKVVLVRTPSFDKNSAFTAKMDAAFIEYGKPELSDLYLFDSVGLKEETSLVSNNDAINRWLVNHGVEPKRFLEVMNSDAVKKRINQNIAIFQQYSPPFTPMAVLNGKYVLLQNTLYNDDYTYAVLDFLVDKIQQEK